MARDRSSRPEARPLRLFIAVDVPLSVKDELASAVAPFRDRVPLARWTGFDGWHVTVKFLGSTWPRLVETVREAVSTVAAETPPFESALTEVGAFPTPTRARVLWAGLDDPDGLMVGVAERLDEELADDFVAEKRAFTPHLTVARLNPPRNLREFAPDLVGLPMTSRRFAVDSLVLYRSHLSPRGATYEAVFSAPFSGGG
jgi:RNA 2',3'-cyclic 3'-phosphodiesterase